MMEHPDMTTVFADNAKTAQAEAQDRELTAKMDKHFASTHRQAPNGRNMFAFRMRYLDNRAYQKRFDLIKFKEPVPGSKEWLDEKYGKDKGERKVTGFHSGRVK